MSSYLLIEDFKGGLDSRRSRITAKPGTLWNLVNAHINRGGEIEKRKAFVLSATLPTSQTFGLISSNANLYVFGSVAGPVVPANVQYQQLVHPTGIAMTGILSTDTFNGAIYAVAQFADGSVYAYYGGVRVTTWDAIVSAGGNNQGISQALANQLNNDPNFTSTFIGNSLTITGRNVNVPFSISVSATAGGAGSPTISSVLLQPSSPTKPQISNITIGGVYDPANFYQVIVSVPSNSYTHTYFVAGTSIGIATIIKTFQGKMYGQTGGTEYFSSINDPTYWSTTQLNGCGFIEMDNQDAGSETLTGMGVYLGHLAVFARRTVQLWLMNADPTQNTLTQTLNNIGTYAPRSIINYGDLNLFFLSDIGIRSLVPRDASGNAYVSDVGTPIDTIIQANNQNLTPEQLANACAILEPTDGRYWICIGPFIYVYSYFVQSNILAWSYYEPGFTTDFIVYSNGIVYLRSGDQIYAFGGFDGQTYDSCPVTVELPHLDSQKPANWKTVRAIDMAVDNTWQVWMGADPSNPSARDYIGEYTGETYSQQTNPSEEWGSHMGALLTCNAPGYARLSNLSIHFDDDGSK